jgi:hypothetical protein
MLNKRPSDEPVVWIAGCSIAHGIAVEQTQRFGNLVSEQLKMTPVYLTEPGTSIEWSTNQILRSDIRPGDKLVWGVTGINRYYYYAEDGRSQNIAWFYYKLNPSFQKTIDERRLTDMNLAYKASDYIHQVTNFLKKVGSVDYCMIWVMPKNQKNQTEVFLKLTQDIPKFILGLPESNGFIDFGTDNQHPGPLQHKSYAEKVLTVLGNNN